MHYLFLLPHPANSTAQSLAPERLTSSAGAARPGEALFANLFSSTTQVAERRPATKGTNQYDHARVQKIPHDLRHTCSSLAVSAGVNIPALRRMPGHTSAKATLDTYADLFDDDLDAVAVTLDSRYSRESVAKMWPRNAHESP